MRILVIAPYAPMRDGIAAYTVQTVARLRAAGHDVEVLSPFPSAAHHHVELGSVRGALRLLPYVRRYDSVLVQYHPDVFFKPGVRVFERERIAAALALVWRAARHVELRVHEADYAGKHTGLDSMATRAMWRAASRIVVHTRTERKAFHETYGLPLGRITVVRHGGDFAMRTDMSRAEARRRLHLPEHEVMFLSIGFIQPHKGFDRSIRAFADAGAVAGQARLDIVGSVRVEEPQYVAHLDELRSLAAAIPGVHLHVGFAGDDEFDTWIVASDCVVLPYRYIWSSSVLERAALYERPVIAARVGGLQDQVRGDSVLVSSDDELITAMRQFLAARGVSAGGPPPPSASPWPLGQTATRADVEREIAARAAVERELIGGAPATGVAAVGRARDARAASAAVRRLPRLHVAAPDSPRPGATFLKTVIRRLTQWELDPIVRQVNALQRATVESLERSAQAQQDDQPAATSRTLSPDE
ncbi:MAG: glycosyltransferase family 4 protein [Candidatus Dormibacteraeota bacterium]|nr:glycosyltransferase family 4 protein [Candidatus Dormibacteraeota bacterium]